MWVQYTLRELSSEAVTKSSCSPFCSAGLMLTQQTRCWCPPSDVTHVPDGTSQTFRVRSLEQVNKWRPSNEYWTHQIHPLWPTKLRVVIDMKKKWLTQRNLVDLCDWNRHIWNEGNVLLRIKNIRFKSRPMSCPVGLAWLSHSVTCELSPPVASLVPSGDHATQRFIEVRPGLCDVTSHWSVLTNNKPKPPEGNIAKYKYMRKEIQH